MASVLNISQSFSALCLFNDGASNTQTSYDVANNNEAFALVSYSGGPQGLGRFVFALSESTVDSQTITYNQVGSSQGNFVTTSHMLNANTDPRNCPLLELANKSGINEFYFDGQQQTIGTLLAYMKNKYGSQYNSFGYETVGGGNWFQYPPSLGARLDQVTFSGQRCDNTVAPHDYQYVFDAAGEIEVPNNVPLSTLDDLKAYFIFGDPVEPNKLRFTVFVDGASEPSIYVDWSWVSSDPDFYPQIATPVVALYMEPSDEETREAQHPERTVTAAQGVYITDANPDSAYVDYNTFTFAGHYQNQYLTINNGLIGSISAVNKQSWYGDPYVAPYLTMYLRFKYQVNTGNQGYMTWGQMFGLTIPRKDIVDVANITVYQVPDSEYAAPFTTEVEVRLGVPTDDDDTPPPPDPDPYPTPGPGPGPGPEPTPFVIPTGFPGHAVLTKTYSMVESRLQNVGTKLWSQSYFDVMRIQNNPIENIVSCKWFPFGLAGVEESIKIGDVDLQTLGDRITNIYKMTIGTATFGDPYYNSAVPDFLRYSPFTQVKLHLPYIGIVQMDATEIYGRTLKVEYVVDLISGDCMAIISASVSSTVYAPLMNVGGHMGVDIPLTSSDRVQQEIKAAGTTISAGLGAAAHLMGGDALGATQNAVGGFINVAGMDYNTQRTGSHNSACSSFEATDVWAEIWCPRYQESPGFKYLHGYPCHKYKKLSELSGFTKCDARTKINVAMTAEENRMLEDLLTTGIYV